MSVPDMTLNSNEVPVQCLSLYHTFFIFSNCIASRKITNEQKYYYLLYTKIITSMTLRDWVYWFDLIFCKPMTLSKSLGGATDAFKGR